MKLKLNKDGSAVVRDGKPVYVMHDGSERAIDGAAAMKLAIGKHFEASPVMAGLKIPHEIAAAYFGDSFHIQNGKLVALDDKGIQLYSGTRHGEAANFDEALGQLVERYPRKATILREPANTGAAPGQQGGGGGTITRQQFDAMPQGDRAKFFMGGGRIADATDKSVPPPPKPAPGSKVWTRAQYDAAPFADRPAFFAAGGKLVD
jgi:hypothetical protein